VERVGRRNQYRQHKGARAGLACLGTNRLPPVGVDVLQKQGALLVVAGWRRTTSSGPAGVAATTAFWGNPTGKRRRRMASANARPVRSCSAIHHQRSIVPATRSWQQANVQPSKAPNRTFWVGFVRCWLLNRLPIPPNSIPFHGSSTAPLVIRAAFWGIGWTRRRFPPPIPNG